jgi:O-antigen/teichoic acid export membrane protein
MNYVRNALQLQSSKLIQVGLALIASLIIARTLGPRGAGVYASLLAFAVLLQGLTSVGFEDLVLARGPRLGGDSPSGNLLYASTYRIRLATVALFAVATVILLLLNEADPFGSHSSRALAAAVAYGGLNSLATLGATIQAARSKVTTSSLLDTSWSFLTTLAYAICAFFGVLTVTLAVEIAAFAQFFTDIGYILLYLDMRRTLRHASLRSTYHIPKRQAGLFWVNGLLSIGVGKSSDVLALRVAGGSSSQAGLYNAGYNAYQTATQVLLQGIGTISYVALGRTYGLGNAEKTARVWRQTVVVGLLASVPALSAVTLFSKGLLVLLYGKAFGTASIVLAILSISGIFARMTGGGSNNSLLFLGERQSAVLWTRGIVVSLNVAFDVVLFRLYGLDGVACSAGLSAVGISIVELILARRSFPLRVPALTTALITASYTFGFGIARVVIGQADNERTIASCFSGFMLGTFVMLLSKPIASSDLPDLTGAHAALAFIGRSLSRGD